MTREDAREVVVEAARKVAGAHLEDFKFEWHYTQVLAERIAHLRKAIEDLDRAVEDSQRGIEGDKDNAA